MDDHANLDYDRAERCGFPGGHLRASKTPEQICTIATQLLNVTASSWRRAWVRTLRGSCRDTFRTHAGSSARGLLFADRREASVEGMTLGEVLACPNRARVASSLPVRGTSDMA